MIELPIGGYRIRLAETDRITDKIKRFGSFEPESLDRWARMVEPDGVAIDVGAYSGLYAIIAAKLGVRAIAIEPAPWMLARLTENCVLNKASVWIIPAAASDRSGTALLHHSRTPMTSGASLEALKGGGNVEVATTQLDDLDITERVTAIKIDVERHEANVLRGALRLIEAHKPKLLIEVLGTRSEQDGAIAKLLHLLPDGYRLVAMLDGRNACMEWSHGEEKAQGT